MVIRKLNDKGLEEFGGQLFELRAGSRAELDLGFLAHSSTSLAFADIDLSNERFATKLEIARYLVDALDLRNNRAYYYDVGLWSWLAAYYFDLVCPLNNGVRSVKAQARYVLADPKNWRRYYRHLLAFPSRLYCDLGDLSVPFLSSPIHIWGDVHEQLAAYQNIATNRGLIGAAIKLYWDETSRKIKRGASSKGRGSARRFSDVIGQFELTYDLNGMQSDEVLQLLPETEFGRWQSS